jgi:hypothetical protein
VIAVGLLLLARWQAKQEFVDSDQLARGKGAGLLLEPGKPVGQTFVARHGGLTGIEFFLLPSSSVPMTLTLHLDTAPYEKDDPLGLSPAGQTLATASLEIPGQSPPGFYRFDLPSQVRSHGEYYYAYVDNGVGEVARASGQPVPQVEIALADGSAYLDGAAYQNHEALDAQTAFRLVYAPGGTLLDLLQAALGGLGLMAAAILLFVVPGWALLAWLLSGRHEAPGEYCWVVVLALATGVSVALYPLLLLWTDVVGLHLGKLYVWAPVAAGLAALVWRHRHWRPRDGWKALQRWAGSSAAWPDLALLILLALVLVVRFLVIRTLDAPLWGDSFQHSLVAQLLVDNGGLFDSWAPYAELTSLTYHFGFQSASAALQWLVRTSAPQATLWVGQVLNVLAVLAIYPLGLRVTGSRWAATWAVLLAGLLSPMPMSYTNWGRYTQLAGQVILPAAVWLTWDAIEKSGRRRGLLLLAMLLAGGLALTHYRVLIFYGVFVLALFLVSPGRASRREAFLRLITVGVGAGLLFLPWLLRNLGGDNLQMFGILTTQAPAQAHPITWEYNAIGDLRTYLDPLWWFAMVLGLGLGLWQRRRGVLLMAVWWLLLLVATNPNWLSLPGAGVISNFALFIFAYLPAGIFSGVLVATAARWFARPTSPARPGMTRARRWAPALGLLVMVGLGIWGLSERLGDMGIDHHALVTRPDVRAAAWIRDNTLPGDRFLVNSFPTYADSSIVGSDAGWWLPLLAGRQTTVPPLNYSSEQGPTPDYEQRVNELSRQVREAGPTDDAVVAMLQDAGVTHVYIGQRQGTVNTTGLEALDPGELLDSPYYQLLYHKDRVWVFELIQ